MPPPILSPPGSGAFRILKHMALRPAPALSPAASLVRILVGVRSSTHEGDVPYFRRKGRPGPRQ